MYFVDVLRMIVVLGSCVSYLYLVSSDWTGSSGCVGSRQEGGEGRKGGEKEWV